MCVLSLSLYIFTGALKRIRFCRSGPVARFLSVEAVGKKLERIRNHKITIYIYIYI